MTLLLVLHTTKHTKKNLMSETVNRNRATANKHLCFGKAIVIIHSTLSLKPL